MKTTAMTSKSIHHFRSAKIILLACTLFLILISSSNAQLTAQAVQNESLTVKEEFSVESHDLLYPDQTYTPLTTYNGATYLVYVNKDRYTMLAKYKDGKLETSRLDKNDDYRPLNNGHNKFSLGIDNDGFIHVTGDTHHYPFFIVGHLPKRLKGGRALYWVSDKPEDISSFSFKGKSEQSPQGKGHTYIYFVNDNNGVLYYVSRTQIPDEGPQGMNIEKYDVKTKTWTQLGEEFHDSGKKIVAWNANAQSYQGMRSDLRFDKNNRMHFAVIVRNGKKTNPNGGGHKSASGVIYAYSDDGGETFQRTDGTKIKLPMWSHPDEHQADVITKNQEWISMPASIAFNQNNEPFVHYVHIGGDPKVNAIAKYRQWNNDSKSWSPIANLPLNTTDWDRQWNDGRGVITLSSRSKKQLYRTSSLTNKGKTHAINFTHADRRYLKQTGELRGLSKVKENGKTIMKVVTLITDLPQKIKNK